MWPLSPKYPEVGVAELCEEYDFIIVGGGTSGCALANRLSMGEALTVLLIERGFAEDTWVSTVPLLSMDLTIPGSGCTNYDSMPQGSIEARKQKVVCGNVLGGTSRIGSMVYSRGIASEYNAWRASGRQGWGYDELLPLFMKSEHCMNGRVDGERGVRGEWSNRRNNGTYLKVIDRVMRASETLGFPSIEDVNSSASPALGCAMMDFTVDSKGCRQSAFSAFLPSKLVRERRSRLHVCTGTVATKLQISRDVEDSDIVNGVYIRSSSGGTRMIRIGARREVIVCCGALGSPQLLQLSGIGPRDLLESLNIPLVKHLPAVGMYLQDHLAVPLVFSAPIEDSLVSVKSQFPTFAQELAKYMATGSGLFAFPDPGLAIFARTDLLDSRSRLRCDPVLLDARDPENRPNVKITLVGYDASGVAFDKNKGSFALLAHLLRPESTGTVRITSTNPDIPAKCDLGLLSSSRDWAALRASVRLAIALFREVQVSEYPLGAFQLPTEDNDTAFDAYIRKWATSTHNYSSTCRMAPEDHAQPGVVDDELRVHGIRRLRVADSSIFPQIIGSPLQAPSVMVAEKCAELLIESYRT